MEMSCKNLPLAIALGWKFFIILQKTFMKNFSHLQSVHTEVHIHRKSILSKIAISCYRGGLKYICNMPYHAFQFFKGEFYYCQYYASTTVEDSHVHKA